MASPPPQVSVGQTSAKAQRLMSTSASNRPIIRVHCNACNRQTKHEVLHRERTEWHETIHENPQHSFDIGGSDVYQMLRCCGCEHICLRHESWFSEDSESFVSYHPPIKSRAKPDWLTASDGLQWQVNAFIHEILDEIYEALHVNAYRLVTMGIRSLLEHVMQEKIGDLGNFARTLDVFHREGHITSHQRERLATILDVGHASVHRQFKPEPEDLRTALDIAESLIADIYVHPDRARRLAKRVPARGKRVGKEEAR